MFIDRFSRILTAVTIFSTILALPALSIAESDSKRFVAGAQMASISSDEGEGGSTLNPKPVVQPLEPSANGTVVKKTNFSVPCGGSGIGVGIAFDGEFIWYSCYNTSPDLFKATALTGTVVASYTVSGGLGALAWDGKRKKIWAGWGTTPNKGKIYLIDPITGAGAFQFSVLAAAAPNDLDDGLAFDAQDDSLYISADTSTTIHHYSVSGASLGSFAWAGSGCYNSGSAIGGDLLFQGSDGCNHVWVVKRSDHSAAFDFATNVTGDSNFRDEDLECDSVTFSPKTVMWSMEAYEPRRAVAFEIPAGTCATGGGVDSDGDGLLDEWEKDGVTIDPDGDGPLTPQFINLPAMGADLNKPDVYLQIDWMQDATHNQQLSSTAIQRVVEAFANSPYTTTTGSVGINLHVDQGATSVLTFSTGATWGGLSHAGPITYVNNLGTNDASGNYNWAAFQVYKDARFTPTGRTPIFHYVIAAHNYDSTTSSGISRGIGASDLIVSLGSFTGGTGSIAEQAGTLMHELGHNLWLRHGGGDDTNFKPNYLGIMNYHFQMGGVISGGVGGTLDYSRQTLASLNKANLSEPAGLGAASAGYGTRKFCTGGGGSFVTVANANAAIDWNCNGNSTETGVAYDINNSGGVAGTLPGFNDWANLILKGGGIGLAGITVTLPITSAPEILTVELANMILPPKPHVYLPYVRKD